MELAKNIANINGKLISYDACQEASEPLMFNPDNYEFIGTGYLEKNLHPEPIPEIRLEPRLMKFYRGKAESKLPVCQQIDCPFWSDGTKQSYERSYGCQRYPIADACHLIPYSDRLTSNQYGLYTGLRIPLEELQRVNEAFFLTDKLYLDQVAFFEEQADWREGTFVPRKIEALQADCIHWQNGEVSFRSDATAAKIWDYLQPDKGAWIDDLPEGWRISAVDSLKDFRVVSFRVSVLPTVEAGNATDALLKRIENA